MGSPWRITAEPPLGAGAFQVIPLLREPFVVVAAGGAIDRDHDVLAQLVRYSRAMPLGRAIAVHRRWLRLVLPERYAFDASRSVFAMVRNCGGAAPS